WDPWSIGDDYECEDVSNAGKLEPKKDEPAIHIAACIDLGSKL
ncbi:hypothetical protein Tco_0968801, partial [Tanacetum coccineum]